MRLKDRIKVFLATHRADGKRLTGTKFASILQTPYATFEHWMRERDKQPPGCMLTLMDVLEQCPEARKVLGITE